MATKEQRDYYEILGVPRDADGERIREAFLEISRRDHPDVSNDPAAHERFRAASQAYEVLSQRDGKLLYDRLAYRGPGNGGFGPAHAGVGRPTADSAHISDGELLDWIFHGRRPGRPEEVVGDLELSPVEAERGTNRRVRFKTDRDCEVCSGVGRVAGAERRACSECRGSGRRRMSAANADGRVLELVTCTACAGSGIELGAECARCDGSGAVEVAEALDVFVPPGIRDGQHLVVGQTNGARGSARNLTVIVRIPHRASAERLTLVIAAGGLVCALAFLAFLLGSG